MTKYGFVLRRISYKKQALFGMLLLLMLAAAVEGALQVKTQLFPDRLCPAMRGDAADGLDTSLKRQICHDTRSVQFLFGDYTTLRPDQHHPTISINSHGFRGPEFEVQRPEGTYRVFVIGGSSAFGSGNVDSTTIPAHLERMYREAGLPFRVEVINAGIPSAQSHTESMLVKDRILGMDPDLLIVYDGHNDIVYSMNNPGLNERMYGMSRQYGALYDTYLQLQNIVHPLQAAAKHSKILPYLEERALVDYTYHDDSPLPPKVAAWKERWGEICGIGRERGFEVLVTVQPVLGSGNQTMTAYYEEFHAGGNGPVTAGKIHRYADALEDMSPSCPFTLDLTHAFDGHVDDPRDPLRVRVPASSAAFLDGVHLSDYGNREIASDMYDASVPIIMSASVT